MNPIYHVYHVPMPCLRPVNIETQVQSHACPCAICDGHCLTGTGFLFQYFIFPQSVSVPKLLPKWNSKSWFPLAWQLTIECCFNPFPSSTHPLGNFQSVSLHYTFSQAISTYFSPMHFLSQCQLNSVPCPSSESIYLLSIVTLLVHQGLCSHNCYQRNFCRTVCSIVGTINLNFIPVSTLIDKISVCHTLCIWNLCQVCSGTVFVCTVAFSTIWKSQQILILWTLHLIN